MGQAVVMVGRRVGTWLVAAVVVTVALVAGGVLLARGGSDRSPAVLPALDLGATQDATAGAAREPARLDGAEPARPYDPGDAPQLWPPVDYQLKGSLPTLPDRARVWKLGDGADPGRVAALAAALGLRGQPREEPSGWTVIDGSRALTVNRLAGVPWSYGTGVLGACVARSGGGPYRPDVAVECLDPDTPVSDKPESVPGGTAAGSSGSGSASSPSNPGTGRPVPPVTVKPVAPAKPWRPVDLPSREQTERIARDLAAKAGLELDGAQVRVADAYAARLVSIAPAVGGLPTSGFAWTVSVGSKGRIQHATGYLATPEPGDVYPLIGVAEGFERLKRIPPSGPLRTEAPAIEQVPCPAAGKLPCAARPLPVRAATVTGVRLGLQLAAAVAKGNRPADVAYLLPAHLFDLDGGWTDVRPVIAVQDRYLTQQAP
jgi:hypothetical protein